MKKNHRNGDQISDCLGCRGLWEWEAGGCVCKRATGGSLVVMECSVLIVSELLSWLGSYALVWEGVATERN